jgi:hypothetical protein
MTPARWTFAVVFGLSLLTGLVIGVTELVAPEAADVSLNGQDVTGMTAFWTSLGVSAAPGAIFGLIFAGIVALFTRKKRA